MDSYNEFNALVSLYNNKNDYVCKDVVNLIHDGLESGADMTDMLVKILSKEKILKECLTFDLLNYNPCNQVSTVDDAISVCLLTLKKYQYKVGGYTIEDADWIIADSSSHRFKVKENQKILYNSINKINYNSEIKWFLDAILNYTKKQLTNIKIDYKVIDDTRNCVCWLVFVVSEN